MWKTLDVCKVVIYNRCIKFIGGREAHKSPPGVPVPGMGERKEGFS